MLSVRKKINDYENFAYKVVIVIASYLSFVLFYLTYDVTQSPDFEKYIDYFYYYNSEINNTGLEQGNYYFFLCYLFTVIIQFFKSNLTVNELINFSVHFANNFIFLFGIFGFYKLLMIKKFNKFSTFLVLTISIFLPASIILRLTLKPEILVFALLGWFLYLLEKFYLTKSNFALIQLIVLASLIFTSKISIAFMFGIFIFFKIQGKYRFLISKSYFKYLIFFMVLLIVLIIENNFHNGMLLNEVKHNENYNNVAELNVITQINSEDLINNPNRYFHSNSFISITLFDTFNDFFMLYWNSEYTELNKDRKDFFNTNSVNNNSPFKVRFDKESKVFSFTGNFDVRWNDSDYINETRMRFSFIASIMFYALIVIVGLSSKENKLFIFSPLIGVITVITSALGYFGTKNFDPLVGDSFKMFYYSFFVILSFIFIFSEIFKINKFGRKTLSLLLIIMFLFFIGFPFSYSQDVEEDLIYKNSLLPVCKFNEIFINRIYSIESEVSCKEIKSDSEKFTPVKIIDDVTFKINIKNIPFVNILLGLIMLYFPVFKYVKNWRK